MKLPGEMKCPYCGLLHDVTCPRIKAMEYHENGTLKRVEFHGEMLEKRPSAYTGPQGGDPAPSKSSISSTQF